MDITCDGSHANCIRFEDLYDLVKCHGLVKSEKMLTIVMKNTYSNLTKKRIGHKRKTIFCGIQKRKMEVEIKKLKHDLIKARNETRKVKKNSK